MWRGTFESEESGDGRRCYRLRWEPRDQLADQLAPLTEREMRAALFVRYLIGAGKIGEGRDKE